jgi:hypothetical protein
MLVLPAGVLAQSPRTPTVFSPTAQMGAVNVRAALVLADYGVKPLPLMNIVARRTDRPDSVSLQTDLDGRVMMSLRVGTYTLRAKTLQPVGGWSYAWSVRVVVRPSRTQTVQLTNANADSVRGSSVVASAPATPAPVTRPAPAVEKPAVEKPAVEKPAVQKPAVQKPAVVEKPVADPFSPPPGVTPRNVASVDSSRMVGPSPALSPSRPAVVAPTPAPVRPSVPSALPRANTSKLILGLALNGSGIQSEELTSSTESGAGLSGLLGWGFTKNFAILLDASAARIESFDGNFDLAHVDMSGRWHFVSSSHGFVPFVEVGYSGRAAIKQDVLLSDDAGTVYTGDLRILGGGITVGGGLEYFVAPTWALGGSFKWTTGRFDRVQFDNVTVDGLALDATSARFNVGFSWYPMRGAR